jgi:exonuclease SbcD
VRVFLTDEALPLQAKARLQRRFPHIAELRHRPPHSERASMSERHQRVRQASSPIALLRAFFDDQQGRPATPAEQHLLRQALDAASRHGRGLQASAEADSEGGMEADTEGGMEAGTP